MLLSCQLKIEKSKIVLAPGFLNPKSESIDRFSSALEVSFNFFNVVQKSLYERLERWTYARPNQVTYIILEGITYRQQSLPLN